MGMTATRNCVDCGKPMRVVGNRKRCATCGARKEKEDRRRVDAVGRTKRTQLLSERGNKCEKCGASGTLHAHHIKPRKDGGNDNTSNIQLLCPSCHKRIHGARG